MLFYKDTNNFEKYKEKTQVSVCINMEELEAINEFIKEMGWKKC